MRATAPTAGTPEEVFLEAPVLLAANVPELKLVLHRIGRLPRGKWGPGLVPPVWYHPPHRIGSGHIDQFAAIKHTPVRTPTPAVVGLHKYVGGACVIHAAQSQYEIGSLSTLPVLPEKTTSLSQDRVVPLPGVEMFTIP